MCAGDLVLFDSPDRTKCNQLPGSWSCSWSVLLLQKGQGWLGTIKGCGTASEVTWVQLRASWPPGSPPNPLCSCLAKDPEQLHQNSWVQTSVSVSCCAGDWCKPFDIVFRRTSMDLRGVTNSAACCLLSGILTLCYLIFTFPPCSSAPWFTWELVVSWNRFFLMINISNARKKKKKDLE